VLGLVCGSWARTVLGGLVGVIALAGLWAISARKESLVDAIPLD
jgi:hypothetical protein